MKNRCITTLIIALGMLLSSFKAQATPKDGALLQGNLVGDGSPSLATGSPTPVYWNQGASTDPTAFAFDLNDGTKLTVKKAGDYFVAATVPVTDPSARATIAAELYVNGEPVAGSRSASSYMRNANSHNESTDNIAQLVPGLAEGDVIELRVSKTTKSATPATINTASMYVERVDGSRTVFAALSEGPDDGDDNINRNFDEEDPAPLSWTSVRKDSGFTHSDGGHEISLSSGTYLITANVPMASTVARAAPGILLTLSGSEVPGGRAEQGYMRNADNHNQASVHFSGVIEVSGSQKLQVGMWQKGNGGLATVAPGKQASLFIEKLGGGVLATKAQETTDDVNLNPPVPTPIDWGNADVSDGAYSGPSNGQITVKEEGNYLLVYNGVYESGVARANPKATVQVNGANVLGASTSSAYIRNAGSHVSASSSLVYLLDGLAANDKITVSLEAEAQSGEVLAEIDPLLLGLIKKEAFVPDPASGLTPRLASFSSDFNGWNVALEEIGVGINQDSISVTMDGESISPSITRKGFKVLIDHAFGFFPRPGQVFTVVVSYNDTATPAASHSESVEIKAPSNFGFLSADFKVDDADTSKPGFVARVSQISDVQVEIANAFQHGNTGDGAEKQLRGEFLDPDGNPWLNEAGDFDATTFEITPTNLELINLDQAEGSMGNFNDSTGFPDGPIPGIPGFNDSTDGIAAEFLAYVELKAGFNTMGVNSDDGFRVTSGPSPVDKFGTLLGVFEGGRGAADTTFNFVVEEAGVYPMRLLWYEGRGGANCEWFSVVDGEKILVNDTSNANGNKAYRETKGGQATYASKVSPSPGANNVAPDALIEVELTDGTDAVDKGTVSMTLNGATVNASVEKSGGITTVSFRPEGFMAPGSTQNASLSYNGITRNWSFSVMDYRGPTLDSVGEYPGLITGAADYTGDGGGRSGEAGDYGMDMTPAGGSVVVTQFDYLKDAFANDELTVVFWQKKHTVSNSSSVWITSASAGSGNRGFQAHTPWGNNQIFFDTQGCCAVPNQRLNGAIADFPDYQDDTFWTENWHLHSYTKQKDFKEIRIDGELFLDSVDADPLTSDVTGLFIGSDGALGNNDLSIFDDFAIFSKALSESDLKAIAGGKSPADLPASKGLIAYWDFNDAGSTAPPVVVDPPVVEPPVVEPPVVLPPIVLPPIPGQQPGEIKGIARAADGSISIEYTGTLQAADTVDGSYAPVAGASSPFAVDASGSAKFYIAR